MPLAGCSARSWLLPAGAVGQAYDSSQAGLGQAQERINQGLSQAQQQFSQAMQDPQRAAQDAFRGAQQAAEQAASGLRCSLASARLPAAAVHASWPALSPTPCISLQHCVRRGRGTWLCRVLDGTRSALLQHGLERLRRWRALYRLAISLACMRCWSNADKCLARCLCRMVTDASVSCAGRRRSSSGDRQIRTWRVQRSVPLKLLPRRLGHRKVYPG